MKSLRKIGFVLVACALTFSACERLKEEIELPEWQSSIDNAESQNAFDDITKQVDEQIQSNGFLRTPVCASVTITPTDSTKFPKTITLDFDAVPGCISPDGRVRTGKIITTLSDRWRNPNATMVVRLQNYTVNGMAVEGKKTILNNGRNAAGNLSYTTTVDSASITDTNGKKATWQAVRTMEWILGESTTWHTNGVNGILDDVYLITGSASGVNRNNVAYTATIVDALRKELSCKWLVSGKIELTPANMRKRAIDYGTGTCDNTATVTVGTQTHTITLR